MTKQTIEFLSRGMIKKRIKDDPLSFTRDVAVISISDTMTELGDMEQMLEELDSPYAVYSFADIDVGPTGMSERQAESILRFVTANRDCNFVVHCWAGISRSSGVAKFINEYLDINDLCLRNYKGYNRRVYNKMMAAAGLSMAAYYEQLELEDRKNTW